MTKRKGLDFAHEWTLQIQASSVYELTKFKSILEFWSIFNNLEEILARIPAACRIDLFKSYAKAWWHDLPGGAWVIPVPFESVPHVFSAIAMILVGEICNGSEYMYGLMLNWNLDGANEFWIWNYTDPPTSTDFAVRIRSVLDVNDHHLIEFRSQKKFGFGVNGESKKWRSLQANPLEDSEQSELSELSNGPSDLSYDRQYLKRFSFSEDSQDLPASIESFDWSLLFLPPTSVPSFVSTISTLLCPSDWITTSLEQAESPGALPIIANGDLPQTADNDVIKVAEAGLDDLPESQQSPSSTSILCSVFSQEGCAVCMLTEKFDEIIAFPCTDRGCLHAMHCSCADDAPSLDRLGHAPFHFNVECGTLEVRSDQAFGDLTKVMLVHVELRHLLGHRLASTVDASASVCYDAVLGFEYIEICMGASPKNIVFDLSRARLILTFKVVSTGLQWRYDASFDISTSIQQENMLLTIFDHALSTELSIGLVRVDGATEISSLKFGWKKTRSIRANRTGGGPVRPSTPEEPVSTSPSAPWNRPNIFSDVKDADSRSQLALVSRTLHEDLTSVSTEKFAKAFEALLPQFSELVVDSFGHYTAEKVCQLANADQRLQLLRALESRFVQIACHKLGSFFLQSVMEILKSESEIKLFTDILCPHVRYIVSNPSGHYVLLRYLDLFSYPRTKFIFEKAIENVIAFSTDHYGLRVMKVLVQVPHNPSLDRLLDEIAANTLLLVENQYGNYLIQLVLSLDSVPSELTNAIVSRMIGRFAKLSKQKFSSNVVEQCLRRGSYVNRNQIIKELIGAANLLIRDRFGNYVLQTALECTPKPQMTQLVNAISNNLNLLRGNVRAKWTGILRDKLGLNADSILDH